MEAEALVSGFRQTWNLLDDNLRLFVRRFDSSNTAAVGASSSASGGGVGSELVRFFRSFHSEVRVDEARVLAELQQRCAVTKQTLEELAKHVSSGSKNERFEEIHATFAGLLQKFSALNEQHEALKVEHEEYAKKCAALADEVAALGRKNDRLGEQLRAAREEGAAKTAAPAPEPVEKKRKNDDEQQPGAGEEAALLARRVAALEEENLRLATERDNNLLNYRNITEVCSGWFLCVAQR